MIEKSITSTHGEVFYWVKRNIAAKCSIVFCHGLTADHTLFDKQIEYFTKDCNVLTWDMPLHGKSTVYRDFSLTAAAEDLHSIIERERLFDIVLVAQSGGGYVAQQYIRLYGNDVSAFVGVDTTPFGSKYYGKELFFIKHFADFAKLYSWKYYVKKSVKSAAKTEESRNSFRASLEKLGKDGMLTASKAYYDSFLDIYAEELEMPCPMALVIGENDHTGYVRRYTRAWAKKSGCELFVIKDASHNSNYDNYKQFNEILETFIENNRKQPLFTI